MSGLDDTLCYGYLAYPNPDRLISFTTDSPETLTIIAPPISPDKIAGGTWINGTWWCCEYSPIDNSMIWIIDHLTGTMTPLGLSGVNIHSLAYDDITKTIYACGETHLYTINPSTGVASIVGPYGISGSVMIGIASDAYGNMYAEDLHTDSIYEIDSTTGTATLIGPLGLDLNYGQDMAIDKETNICYLSAFTVHTGNEGALYTVNLTTGIPTKIGTFGTVATQVTGFAIPYTLNYPPDPPHIQGPSHGTAGTTYTYTFTTNDTEQDQIYFYIDWDDSTLPEWYGPYFSNETIELAHSWNQKGTYLIKAKAKDTHGHESDWSYLPIRIPHIYGTILQFLQHNLLQTKSEPHY